MRKWLRRIRGAVGMGLTWAVVWSGVGAIWGLIAGISSGVVFQSGGLFAVVFAALGFVGGAAFSGVLGIIEGRRRFGEMSLPRFAAWGALGGLFLSALTVGALTPGAVWYDVGVLTLLGAGSAAGSLALARRAEDGELLEAGEEALGLTEGA